MIYTCQICGAGFKKEQLEPAIKSKAKFIRCVYCGSDNDFGSMETSHITRGYQALEDGDFNGALRQFGEAIRYVDHLDNASMPKRANIEAYFGRALADYEVQVVYKEEIAELNSNPTINCYRSNNSFFVNSHDYQTALSIALNIPDPDLRADTIARFNGFSKKIDRMKKVYDKRASQNVKYQLFIACVDKYDNQLESNKLSPSINKAERIMNELPDQIKSDKVFINNPDLFVDEDYEGEILYAIHNSACMLVVADDVNNTRLMDIYNRFCEVMIINRHKVYKNGLLFVRYDEITNVHLPDPRIEFRVFESYKKYDYHKFICEINRIVFVGPTDVEPEKIEEAKEDEDTTRVDPLDDDLIGAPEFDATGKHCIFGSYPQRKLHDLEAKQIESHFLPKPNALSYDGWEVMFTAKTGRPYTWYRDKEIDGKKYRAVCFARYRDVFTCREFDRPGLTVQFGAGYKNATIHIFEYSPIEWNVLEEGMNSATLVTSVGLDAHEYNSDFCSIWECTTLRTWLNEDFLNTAFSENQKKFLFHSEDEYVFLIDRKRDLGQIDFRDKLNTYNIRCTDYFGCVGGRSFNGDVCNFWIKDENDEGDSASAVQPHAVGSIIPLGIDNTTVAVIPKIKVRR